MLGGDLTAESELGKGSVFTLVIPTHYGSIVQKDMENNQVVKNNHDPSLSVDSGELVKVDISKKRILVIDDDPDAIYLVKENLDSQEFDIIGEQNGRLGIELAHLLIPHAILLDILMPEPDGWQILNELKNDPITANIPVILLTIVDKKALGFRLGASAYLLKPLDPPAVREALARLISKDLIRPKNILVVDDDPGIADMLGQILPASDYKLTSALDGFAAIESVQKSRPDLILLDLVMPNLDGFGVIEKLRADPLLNDLPVIVISAKELSASESNQLKKSVAMIMKKQEFQGEKLMVAINNVIRSKGAVE
jgi:CheY-like chemotaxis protein